MKNCIPFLLILLSFSNSAQEYSSGRYFSDSNGLMLQGYDPVSYQVSDEPQKGDPAISTEYDGVNYQFATTTNRDSFLQDPDRYIPQFGGFCAYGVGMQETQGYQPGRYKSVPTSYKVVDNKLYVFYPPDEWPAISYWNQDEAATMKRAEALWEKIKTR